MSKNVNKRFFAEFLALLAMTVDPDPGRLTNITCPKHQVYYFHFHRTRANFNKHSLQALQRVIASEHSCLDPDVEPEDPEICLEQKEIEQYKNGDYLNSGNQSSSDESGEGSASENNRHGH